MDKPDEILVSDFQHGDEAAFEQIFLRYKRPILNFSIRMLQNRADAEDVTGEVFMTFYVKKDAYQPLAKFSTWLFTIARNNCISKLRKRKRNLPLWFKSKDSGQYEEAEIESHAPSASEGLINMEKAGLMKQYIYRLPEQQKEALILREYQGFSYEEISSIIGCSLNNVKILIYRARQTLRVEMASYLEEG